jgi:FlaA1/EpsC-like NDP-sugar epimerase
VNKKTIIFWLVFLPDVVLLYASLLIAAVLRYGSWQEVWQSQVYFQAFSAIYVLWLVVFFIHGLFEISSFRRYSGLGSKLNSAASKNTARQPAQKL